MRCVVCWWGDMRPKYRAQRHAHRARVEKRSAPGSFGKVVGTHGAGQQTAPCSEKAQVSPMQLQRSQMRALLRRAAHGMRGGDFTEKRTSGMSRPTPIAAVPPPGQLTSRGQSVGVADGHATTAGAARATRRGREGRRGGDLYGGGCPCSSTPCAGTRGRDKARGAQKVEHMF